MNRFVSKPNFDTNFERDLKLINVGQLQVESPINICYKFLKIEVNISHSDFDGVLAVLDNPNEATKKTFCSEQISSGLNFVHSNQLRIVQHKKLDEISDAESEFVSESNGSSSFCYSSDYD